jgi:cytochrome b561
MVAMGTLVNTEQHYGAVAMLLHWAMALLLVVLIAMAVYMVRLPDAGYDRDKILLILVHKALGMGALAAAALRLAWRLVNPLPRLAASLPAWQQVAARFVHLVFYALLFVLPLTGWLMSSAGGYPVPLFDGFNLPDLIGLDEHRFRLFIAVHRWLGYALLALLLLHAAAALHHHFVRRDDTLRRMLPGA